MIISGAKASNIGIFEIPNSKCNYCEQGNTQRVSVFGKYVHIFWFPIFPIGKKAVAECTYCKRTIEQKEFSPQLAEMYQLNKNKIKRPFWHWLGLGIFGLLVGFITIVGVTAEEDPRRTLLDEDEKLMTASPTMETDSISFKIKEVFDAFATEEINPDEFKYLTKMKDDKALVLVQIPKLRKVEKEGRAQAMEMVEMITNDQKAFEGKDLYIGIKGVVSMILIKTPSYEENSRLALTKELFDFYGPKPETEE